MNYQFGWYLFLRPRTFFIALFLCSFALLGVTAGAVWLIIMGLIYPVAVSMRLHILGQNKAVMLRQTCSEWIVYLPGIPVQEQQSALINAAFPSETALRRFYIRALTSKLILHAVCSVARCPTRGTDLVLDARGVHYPYGADEIDEFHAADAA